MIAYKLLEIDEKGEIHSMFINKDKPLELLKLYNAEMFPTKGFAPRKGFHAVSVPDAPWLKSADGTYKSSRKGFKRVWAQVAICNDEALEGECYNPPLSYGPPEGCFYRLNATANRHECYVSEAIVIVSILTDEIVRKVLDTHWIDPVKTFEPYRKAFEKRKENRR